jgi:hypothetical protein
MWSSIENFAFDQNFGTRKKIETMKKGVQSQIEFRTFFLSHYNHSTKEYKTGAK